MIWQHQTVTRLVYCMKRTERLYRVKRKFHLHWNKDGSLTGEIKRLQQNQRQEARHSVILYLP